MPPPSSQRKRGTFTGTRLRVTVLGLWWIYFKALIRTVRRTIWAFYSFIVDVVIGFVVRLWEVAPLLLIFGLITLFLFPFNVYFQQIITWTINHAMPYIQDLYDILITSLNLLLDLYSIFQELWNVMVPVIGFILYFVIDLAVTLFKQIIGLLGELDLPVLFQDLMEVLSMITQVLVNALKAIVSASVSVLLFLSRIIGILIKLVFLVIRGLVPIVKFVFHVLPIVLKPILWILAAVAAWFSSVFAGSVSMVVSVFSVMMGMFAQRSLLGIEGMLSTESAGNVFVKELGAKAASEYSPAVYDNAAKSLTPIATYLDQVFRYQKPLDRVKPGDKPSDRIEYTEEDTDLGCVIDSTLASHAGEIPKHCAKHHRTGLHHILYENDWHQDEDERHSAAEAKAKENGVYRGRQRDLLEIEEVNNETVRQDFERIKAGDAYVFVLDDTEVYEDADDKTQQQQPTTAHPRPGQKRILKDHEEPHHHHDYLEWEAYYLRDKTPEDVFPGLKKYSGKRLEHKPIVALLPRRSAKQVFDRQVRMHAAIHAFEHSVHHIHRHHIASGHFEWAWKTMMKHCRFNSVQAAVEHYDSNWHSAFHFVHDTIGPPSDWPVLRTFKEWDVDSEPNSYHGDYYRNELGLSDLNEGLRESFRLHAFEMNGRTCDNHTQCGDLVEALADGTYDRRLLAIHLEVLYKRDCYHKPYNFLCLPPPPKGRLKSTNLTKLFLPFENNTNAVCSDMYEPEHCRLFSSNPWPCFFTWNRFLNALTVARYTMVYILDDIIDIIPFVNRLPPLPQLIYEVGQRTPWLQWITNWILIIDKGQNPTMREVVTQGIKPSFRQNLCWFLHLYDVAIYIMLALIISVIGPIAGQISNIVTTWYSTITQYFAEREARYNELREYFESKWEHMEQQMRSWNVASPLFALRYGTYNNTPGATAALISATMDERERNPRRNPDANPKSVPGTRRSEGRNRQPRRPETIRAHRSYVPSDQDRIEHMLPEELAEWRRHNLKELRELVMQYRYAAVEQLKQLAQLYGFEHEFEDTHPTGGVTRIAVARKTPGLLSRIREVLRRARLSRTKPAVSVNGGPKESGSSDPASQTRDWATIARLARQQAANYEVGMRHFFISHQETDAFLKYHQAKEQNRSAVPDHVSASADAHLTFVNNVHPDDMPAYVDHLVETTEEEETADAQKYTV